MDSSQIKRVIILGALAIIGILVIQSYWVIKTWDLKEEEFHQTAKIALIQVATDLAKQDSIVLPTENFITRRSSNYYVVNINNHIHAPTLEHYIGKALIQHKLIVDYEYAIYDCNSNQMIYGNYCELSGEEAQKSPILGDLPKMENLTYYFGVKFPNRQSYLLGQMYLSIFFTILLLLAITFFAYAISIILRQKRLSEMQKDFINNMTHEFKTPISTIKISADVFENAPEIKQNQRLQQYTNIIKEQNQRLNDQVEKVLQIARVEQDSFQLKLEKVKVQELIENVLNSVELRVVQLNGQLKKDLNIPDFITKADKHHLTNVLHNLLDNALKYCKKSPEITVKAFQDKKQIKISIQDNGIGIKKEYQSKVFNKFFRVPTGNIHDVKGFGLGLFYIKNICHTHGWKVHLESEIAKGTNISILIPFPQKKDKNVWDWIKSGWGQLRQRGTIYQLPPTNFADKHRKYPHN